MQCPCGRDTTNLVHHVKGIEKAREWLPTVRECELPVRIDRDRCYGCGRERLRVWSNVHTLLRKRG